MKQAKPKQLIKKKIIMVAKYLGIVLGSLSITAILILSFLPRPIYKSGFDNLQELQSFAQQNEELVKMSNNNTLKPEFNTYYERFKPTYGFIMREKFTYGGSLIHLIKRPYFSVGFFKNLIETLTKEREQKGHAGGTVICKIEATETSKFILFGNIQGAFHSLVRDLEKLKELNIINDQLQVIQQGAYIFFTGNVINRSSYSMETMAAVTRLVQTNPDRVFYLKGNHEMANYWQEHTLKTELQIRAAHLSKELIPLATEVNKFFATLPEAAYISIPGTTHEFIRISHFGRTKSEILDENSYASFLTTASSTPVTYTVLKEKTDATPAEPPIVIRVIFRDEKKRESYQPMEGLRFLAPDIDSVAWNVLSCPTYVYQRAIKFHHDAFVILEASGSIDEWRLNLYSRDAATKEPFKVTTYNMLSGVNLATQKPLERDKPKKTSKKKKKSAAKKGATSKKKIKKPARSLIPTKPTKEEEPQLIPPPPPSLTQQQEQTQTPNQNSLTPQTPALPKSDTTVTQTLEKIHDLLLHITTTLDRIEKRQQPHQQNTPTMPESKETP